MPNLNTLETEPPMRFLRRRPAQLSESLQLFPNPDLTGSIGRSFRFSDLLSLASVLDSEFLGCHGIGIDADATSAVVSGDINLSHDDVKTTITARCEIRVFPDWTSILPEVLCSESWVRSGADWHAGDGYLCYVFDDEWQDLVSFVRSEEGQVPAATYAANLCLRNTRWLLYKHHIASITNMTKWPANWPGRPHSPQEARKQYLREKSLNSHELK
jgi:hypothetical protein